MRLTTPDGAEYTLADTYFEIQDGMAYCQSTTTDVDARLLRLSVISGCKLDTANRRWDDVTFIVDGFSAPAVGKIVADVWLKWRVQAV